MLDFIKNLAQEAGEIVLKTARTPLAEKGQGGDWVTAADQASERFVIEAILKNYPGHQILSEETRTELASPADVPALWVVDPLDGTSNFAFHLPLFAVSIAYLEQGVVRAGAVYDPTRRELFWAEKNQGAFLNGRKIKVEKRAALRGALVDLGCPYGRENFKKTFAAADAFHREGARIVNLGTSALETCYAACGRLSLFYEWGLKPWDIAAAMLVLEEAGGIAHFGRAGSLFHFQSFLAGNPALVKKAQALLNI